MATQPLLAIYGPLNDISVLNRFAAGEFVARVGGWGGLLLVGCTKTFLQDHLKRLNKQSILCDNTPNIKGGGSGTHIIARGSRPNNLFLAERESLDRKQISFQVRELYQIYLSLSDQQAGNKRGLQHDSN